MLKIKHYLTVDGRDIFTEWLRKVKDTRAKAAIFRRVNRLELGNFGDHRPCRDGVWELKIDVGPGYRVYYAQAGKTVILLLSGGDKRSQTADITKACELWRDWQSRN
ncbi:type II toxin-antitoxin system RelE/ParE family toxin [Desulfurivibrio dismutans]|uniref:type II toxin-antitoxin system RelE/ParE family toxin n=1 Tax=Desulfurivibrio dismutans TaxID=1398908 RepID=UPI0023DAED39|nr:type II toxin-antitoxin system RelE/ParE family toxin [Desulfurivibrio alkaliphilus]MDF1614837.1 type II toxin-antitoxin system RelE/ParE family toxin [Desulfurivibrio alkaliphilus]